MATASTATTTTPNHAPSIQTNPLFVNDTENTQQCAERPNRAAQNVLTIAKSKTITKWMIANCAANGQKKLFSRTVKQFPHYFRGNYKANIQRANRYWRQRGSTGLTLSTNQPRQKTTFVRATKQGVRRNDLKAVKGRGRRVSKWVSALHVDLLEKFNRMKKAGVKFNIRLLRRLALNLTSNSVEVPFYSQMTGFRSNVPIKDWITNLSVQSFIKRNNMFSRSQCGALIISPAKQKQVEREVGYHLGTFARDFRSKALLEEDVFNADKTHFGINMNNHKTLALSQDTNVRYADLVSGDDRMTMMVLIAGGANAHLDTPMLTFKNVDKNYTIRGLPDDVPGVVYRTGPKAWMGRRVFLEWLTEKRVFRPLPNGGKRVLFVDNVNTHNVTTDVKQALEASHPEIKFFPCTFTHLVQPADSFVIQKLKAHWRNEWDDFKISMLAKRMWVDGKRSSGKLSHPEKRNFMKLAARSVRTVGGLRDKDGVPFARKAMIRCGMSLNLNGQWEASGKSDSSFSNCNRL